MLPRAWPGEATAAQRLTSTKQKTDSRFIIRHRLGPVFGGLTFGAHPRAARDGAMIIPDASGAARRVQRLLGGAPSATLFRMTIKARVNAGRLVVDEPTDLPDGTELELLPLDPGDWLDEADRAALHKALRESNADVATGRLIDADEILKELRSR